MAHQINALTSKVEYNVLSTTFTTSRELFWCFAIFRWKWEFVISLSLGDFYARFMALYVQWNSSPSSFTYIFALVGHFFPFTRWKSNFCIVNISHFGIVIALWISKDVIICFGGFLYCYRTFCLLSTEFYLEWLLSSTWTPVILLQYLCFGHTRGIQHVLMHNTSFW